MWHPPPRQELLDRYSFGGIPRKIYHPTCSKIVLVNIVAINVLYVPHKIRQFIVYVYRTITEPLIKQIHSKKVKNNIINIVIIILKLTLLITLSNIKIIQCKQNICIESPPLLNMGTVYSCVITRNE